MNCQNYRVVMLATLPLLTAVQAQTGTWSPAASMSIPRVLHTATLLPGGVLVAGGLYAGRIPPATAELYDIILDTWNTTGSMAQPRSRHTATLLRMGEC